MSYAGIIDFKNSLDDLMDSDSFKKANEGDRLIMGGALIRSNVHKKKESRKLSDEQTRTI